MKRGKVGHCSVEKSKRILVGSAAKGKAIAIIRGTTIRKSLEETCQAGVGWGGGFNTALPPYQADPAGKKLSKKEEADKNVEA